MITTQTEAA